LSGLKSQCGGKEAPIADDCRPERITAQLFNGLAAAEAVLDNNDEAENATEQANLINSKLSGM